VGEGGQHFLEIGTGNLTGSTNDGAKINPYNHSAFCFQYNIQKLWDKLWSIYVLEMSLYGQVACSWQRQGLLSQH
jgi:hypothetical protein